MVLIVGRRYHLKCIFTVLRTAVASTALLAALQITLTLLIWYDKANRISSEVGEAYVYVALPSGLASLLTMGALQLVAAGVGLYGVINRFRAPLFAFITSTWQPPCRPSRCVARFSEAYSRGRGVPFANQRSAPRRAVRPRLSDHGLLGD